MWAGALVLIGYLELLFLQARLAEPSRWDTWAVLGSEGEEHRLLRRSRHRPGGFTSYANPDYPPLKPTLDAIVFRGIGEVDTGALVVQHWVVAAAFFGAVAALLSDRVRPGDPLAVARVHGAASRASSRSSVRASPTSRSHCSSRSRACAARSGSLEREVRFLALAAFSPTAALVKNEGLMLTLVLFVMLARSRTSARGDN